MTGGVMVPFIPLVLNPSKDYPLEGGSRRKIWFDKLTISGTR